MKKNILITGAGGYLGSALINKLSQTSSNILAVDLYPLGEQITEKLLKSNGIVINCNILDTNELEKIFKTYKPFACIHLAALVGDPLCSKNEDLAWTINRNAVLEVAKLSKKYGCKRFVFTSTCSVYGFSSEIINEQSITNPLSIYAKSKIEAENLLLKLSSETFQPTIFRLSTLFGVSHKMRFDLTINQFVAESILNKNIDVYASQTTRPYVHVKDVADLIIDSIYTDKLKEKIYNVGHNEFNLTKEEIVKRICKTMEPFKVCNINNNVKVRNYHVNFDKIRNIGFIPKFSIEHGIMEIKQFVENDNRLNIKDKKWQALNPILELQNHL